MTNEETIFCEALGIGPAAERAAYLDRACAGDVQLRRDVEALLAAHGGGDGILESPPAAADGTAPEQRPSQRLGSSIGPYQLLEQIGGGGMGVVYMAEQLRPIRRKVALKIIKPGMDSGQVIARFEAERQALTMMDHPNIAKVLDAGTTEAGRPFFVMELVKGIAITDYCDQARLTTRQRLELFLQVCQAVQHAHQKGVIHRDLKPGNILVTLHDDKAVPKVIDFGIAKATGHQLTDRTLFTNYAQMLGTPLYMSPEQAQISGLDVDTRSDVYSLGVLLYELLTGTTPFEKQRLSEAAYDEMRRIIREEDPPKPSTRLNTMGATLSTVSAHRQTDAKKLGQLVRGELDWIVMKALEKDRTRRYETANGLARDVERHLHDEAVQACPPSAYYRFRKFARRNKGPVVAASLILLTLIGGTLGTTLGLVHAERARRAETDQRQLAEANERKALAAATAERDAKQAAQAREAEARAILYFVEQKVFLAAGVEGQQGGLGREVTLRKAIEAALPFIETSFPEQPQIEARLRNTLGVAFFNLGEAGEAEEQFRKARDLFSECLGPRHPDTLISMGNLANCYARRGRETDALHLREEALALQKAVLGPDHRSTLLGMRAVASSYYEVGRHADALRLLEETLALQRAKLGADHPDILSTMIGLANSYGALKRHADALKLREEALALFKARPGADAMALLIGMNNLASSYSDVGRHADALKLQEETLALSKAKLGPDHPDTLRNMGGLAVSHTHAGRYAESFRLREETLALTKAKLGPDHPDTLRNMANLARAYADLGRRDECLKLQEETLALYRAKLPPDHPDALGLMSSLSFSYAAVGRYADALALWQQTLALRETRLGPDHADTMDTMARVAETLIRLDRGADAVPVIDDYLRRAGPTTADPAMIKALISHRLRHFQKTKDAGGCRTSAEMWEKFQPPGDGSLYDAACYRAATAAVVERDPTTPAADAPRLARVEADRAMALLEQAVAAGYADVEHMKRDADLDPLRSRGDFQALIAKLDRNKAEADAAALTRSAQRLREQPEDPAVLDSHAALLRRLGRYTEAEAASRAAIRLGPDVGGRHHDLADALRGQGRFADAAAEYAQATRLRPAGHDSHYALGTMYAFAGQWEKAEAAFRRAAELNPADLGTLFKWAALCSYTDEQENYRRACRALLDRFGGTANIQVADCTAKACALAAGFGGDPERVIKLADMAMTRPEADPARQWFEITKALVYYRAGRFGEATDIIVRSAPSDQIHRDALALSILSLSQHRLGRTEEARASLAKAQQTIAAKMPKVEAGETFRDDWHDWLHALILCREADGILAGPAPRP